jgi:hypothetical protein
MALVSAKRLRRSPNACARCRTHYWNTAPQGARANRPDDPKWKVERDTLANRRRARHLARLKELAQELGANASAVVVKPTLLPPDAEELPLRGDELAEIVLIDVADILSHDPRLSRQVSYCRLSYIIRVDLRIENAWQETRSVKPANTSLVLPDWSFDRTSSS